MKLWKLFAGIFLLLSLCGCKQPNVTPEQIAEHYQQRSFSAEYTVTTHSGFYTEYKLTCTMQDGVSSVRILQPESVAGITAVVQGAQAQLQYEDLSLDALLPEIPGYAPMDMLHQLLCDLQDVPEFSGKEQGSMVEQLEKGIKTLICRDSPGILNDTERQAVQSYTIYGGYYAYRLYHEADEATAMRAIEKISDRVRPLYSGG